MFTTALEINNLVLLIMFLLQKMQLSEPITFFYKEYNLINMADSEVLVRAV